MGELIGASFVLSIGDGLTAFGHDIGRAVGILLSVVTSVHSVSSLVRAECYVTVNAGQWPVQFDVNQCLSTQFSQKCSTFFLSFCGLCFEPFERALVYPKGVKTRAFL